VKTKPKKLGRPKGSKNKPKKYVEPQCITMSLPRKDLEGVVKIHLDTGVGLHTLFRAACRYLEQGYTKDRKLRDLITELVNRGDE
jgi:hypothetical protein